MPRVDVDVDDVDVSSVGHGQLLLLAPDDVDVYRGGADVVRKTREHSCCILRHLNQQ